MKMRMTAEHCGGKSVTHHCGGKSYYDPTEGFEAVVEADSEEQCEMIARHQLQGLVAALPQDCDCHRMAVVGGGSWWDSVAIAGREIVVPDREELASRVGTYLADKFIELQTTGHDCALLDPLPTGQPVMICDRDHLYVGGDAPHHYYGLSEQKLRTNYRAFTAPTEAEAHAKRLERYERSWEEAI